MNSRLWRLLCYAGSGICDSLITRSEGYYWVCVCVCLIVCALEIYKWRGLDLLWTGASQNKIYPNSELRSLEYIDHHPKQSNFHAQGDNLVSSTNSPYQIVVSLFLYQNSEFFCGEISAQTFIQRAPSKQSLGLRSRSTASKRFLTNLFHIRYDISVRIDRSNQFFKKRFAVANVFSIICTSRGG